MRSGAASTPGSRQGSGGFRCRYRVRFWRVPGSISAEAPEGSVRFQRVPVRYIVRFRRGPVPILCEVPEGSGAGILRGPGSFRCRYSVRFRRVMVQILG